MSSRATFARGTRNFFPLTSFSAQCCEDAFGLELRRDEVRLEAELFQRLGGLGPDNADAVRMERPDVHAARPEPFEKEPYGVGAGEDDPLIGPRLSRAASSSAQLAGGTTSMLGNSMGVAPRSISASANTLAWSRDRVTTMRLPKSGFDSNQLSLFRQRDDLAHDDDRRRAELRFLDLRDDVLERAGHDLLVGPRAPLDEGDGGVGAPAVGK